MARFEVASSASMPHSPMIGPVNRKKPSTASAIKKPKKPKSDEDTIHAAERDKLLSNLEEVHLEPFNIHTEDGKVSANEYFAEHGMVVAWVHKDEEERKWFQRMMVTELWETTIGGQAMTPEFASKVPRITDEASFKRFVGALPASLKKQIKESLGELIFPHTGFGGPCMNRIWHMWCTWWLRQHEELADLAGMILGTKKILCSIDRGSIKLPKMGDHEWIHKDQEMSLEEPTNAEIQGKFCATKGSFICAQGTHKQHSEIFKRYSPHYKKSSSAKWAFLPKKPDPLRLF